MKDQSSDLVSRDDDRAVAPVIAVVILFGFLILSLSLYQAEVVPQQNAGVEFQHLEETRNDLVELRASILQAGSIDRPQYQTVQLGATYPTRVFAINPPTPVGTIQTTDAYPITIAYASNDTVIETVPTRFIQFRPGYNELDQSPVWYDASVLYVDARDEGGGIAVIEEQALVNEGEVQITALQNEFRESGTGRVAIELRPATSVTGNLPEGNLTVTVPTRLSGEEYWDGAELTSEYNVTNDTNDDGVHNLTIETTADNLTVDTVGVQQAPEDPTQNDKARIGGSTGESGSNDEGGGGSVGSVPGEAVAYADADDDLEYDSGETTYTESELYDFDQDVNLVIPSDVGGGTVSNGEVSIIANKITSRVDYEATNNGVTFNTKNAGPIDITGAEIDSAGTTTIRKSTKATLDDVTIIKTGELLVSKADEISATNADVTTNNNGVTLNTNNAGPIDITGARIDSAGATTLTKTTKATLDDVTITKTGELSVTNADEISATNADITTNNNGVTFDADDAGPIDITGAVIDSAGATTLEKATRATLDDVLISDTGKLSVSADEISATNADVTTSNAGVKLDASGPVQASGIRVNAQGKVEFLAAGDISIDDTTDQESRIATTGAAEANFDGGSRTFFIDGVEIADDDDTLSYSPNGVTENGTTETGRVSPN